MNTEPRISFSATALREHFESDVEIEPLLDDLTDDEIEDAAHTFLNRTGEVWQMYHMWTCEIVRSASK